MAIVYYRKRIKIKISQRERLTVQSPGGVQMQHFQLSAPMESQTVFPPPGCSV